MTARNGSSRSGLPCGTTVWVAAVKAQCVALSWDWSVIEPKVVSLFDPLGITSNACLILQTNHVVTEGERLKALVKAVCDMDWQAKVLEHIKD